MNLAFSSILLCIKIESQSRIKNVILNQGFLLVVLIHLEKKMAFLSLLSFCVLLGCLFGRFLVKALGTTGVRDGVSQKQSPSWCLWQSLAWWFQREVWYLVKTGLGLSATCLGAADTSQMASPVPGSYSVHLSQCPEHPADLEACPTRSGQDQMLFEPFSCTDCQPNQMQVCLLQLTSVCWV